MRLDSSPYILENNLREFHRLRKEIKREKFGRINLENPLQTSMLASDVDQTELHGQSHISDSIL